MDCYNGEIYVDHLSYIPIFNIVILCYLIFFLGAKILTQNNARCQLYLWKNHIGCQKCLFHPTCVANLQTLFDCLSKSQSGWILLEFWKLTFKKRKGSMLSKVWNQLCNWGWMEERLKIKRKIFNLWQHFTFWSMGSRW
jgi:hypothetical protein